MAPAEGKRVVEGQRHGLSGWRARWHLLVLPGLIGVMLWMMASLLWPKPQAEIVLTPLHPEHLAMISSESLRDEGLASDALTLDEPQRKQIRKTKSRKYPATRKKPVQPPVTNLNTASLNQFQRLPGIGPKMAQRIVEYRKAHGPFQSPAQVMDVKGIGIKKFEKLKPFLKV